MPAHFPKRDEHSFYNNEVPVKDVFEALHLLARHEGAVNEPTHLARSEASEGWEIVMPWYKDGSSGNDSWGTNYYQIETAVAEELVRDKHVAPYKQAQWGYSTTDPSRLVATSSAQTRRHEHEQALRDKAAGMLTAGTHTDLTGAPKSRGSGRDGWNCGRFYVDFETPLEEVCRVYPEDNEIICPYPPPKPEEQIAA